MRQTGKLLQRQILYHKEEKQEKIVLLKSLNRGKKNIVMINIEKQVVLKVQFIKGDIALAIHR